MIAWVWRVLVRAYNGPDWEKAAGYPNGKVTS